MQVVSFHCYDMKLYRLSRAPAPLRVYLKSARYEHGIFSALVWLAPGAEATLERTSLNKRNPKKKGETEAAVVNGVANPSPAPALIALNIFNRLIWKKNEYPALTH